MDNAKVSASSLERGGEDGRSTSVAYAWFVVTFLMVLLTSSFIDRTILSLMVKPIRADLHLTDTQFSYLAGLAFVLLYTLTGIPLAAYDYIVNGKPALDWVVERQCVKTDKDSGIVNDANDWAVETVGNPKYPLELFMRVVTVSLETMKIVNSLPKLDI